MDDYVGWMEANGYSSRTVFRRLPPLFCFAEFAQRRGCIDVTSALSLVDEFVSEWLVQHGAEAKTSASLRKHAIDIGNATRQMLRLASGGPVRHNRHRRPFPLESEVPGFEEYLRSECGLMESTIHGYRHHLHEFAQYLGRAGINSLGDLSPALLSSFIVECPPGMAPCTRRDLCCHLKVLLRFCHREGITERDLRGAVGMCRAVLKSRTGDFVFSIICLDLTQNHWLLIGTIKKLGVTRQSPWSECVGCSCVDCR
ncbi:MAG: integrase/recombinase XerD [Acidobacteriaceae bacterium]|jgi:integrase/recombinase XerD|nr:integrase/recombinase XerD [Acidobacteriaceae bacterium]MEA2540619.1 integrase/recombinase XerD [Acidobacteriaceae bacterium]